jgi:hypothetical protein
MTPVRRFRSVVPDGACSRNAAGKVVRVELRKAHGRA